MLNEQYASEHEQCSCSDAAEPARDELQTGHGYCEAEPNATGIDELKTTRSTNVDEDSLRKRQRAEEPKKCWAYCVGNRDRGYIVGDIVNRES